MNYRKDTIFLPLWFVICGVCLAQTASTQREAASRLTEVSMDKLADIKKLDRDLGKTAQVISDWEPGTTPELLNDASVILSMRKEVSEDWERAGYDEKSQKKAEAYVWKEMRTIVLKPNEPLKPEVWKAQTQHRGRIAILSTPDKADIHVDDGKNVVDRSNNFIFPPAGPHRFCLKLTGFQDYCESRDITTGIQNDPIEAKLIKVQ